MEPTTTDERLIEHMKNYMLALGALQGIQAENIASMQDAITKISKTFGLNLSIPRDRMEFQQKCRQAALEYLKDQGVVTKAGTQPTPKGPRDIYKVAEGKEQEYKDILYRSYYNKDMMDGLSTMLTFMEQAAKGGNAVLSLGNVLGLTPLQHVKVIGHIAAVTDKIRSAIEKTDDSVKHIVQAASEKVSMLLYQSVDRSEELRKACKDTNGYIKEFSGKVLQQMNRVPCQSIDEARFSEAEERTIYGKYQVYAEDRHNDRRGHLRNILSSYDDIKKGYQSDIFAAFADIDKEIRGDVGRVRREEVSESVREDTKFRLGLRVPQVISLWEFARSLSGQLFIVNRSLSILNRLSFLNRHQDKIPPAIYRAYETHLHKKESVLYEQVEKGRFKKDDLSALQMNISHFNIRHADARERGRNYAEEYAKLNLYRCGISKNLVSAMHLFRMNDVDRLWAVSYMKAGMLETIHGIRYTGARQDKLGMVQRDPAIHRKAEDIFTEYLQQAQGSARRACEKLEADFVDEHRDMVDRIARRREEKGMPVLQEVSHFNRAFDNAKDPLTKDRLDVERISPEEIPGLDVKGLREAGKDGFFIKEEQSAGLFLFTEDCGVVAVTDEHENAVRMDTTRDTYHMVDTRHVITDYPQVRDGMLADIAVQRIAADIGNEETARYIRSGWRSTVDAMIRSGSTAQIDSGDSRERLVLTDKRTDAEFTVCEQEPFPGLHCVSAENYAHDIMEKELRNVLDQHGIPEEVISRILIQEDSLNKVEKTILKTSDPEEQLITFSDTIRTFGSRAEPETALSKEKRIAAVQRLESAVSEEKLQAVKEAYQKFEEKCAAFEKLVRSDPVLAYCRAAVPDCERDGDKIFAYAEKGDRVTVDLLGNPSTDFIWSNETLSVFGKLNEAIRDANDERASALVPEMLIHDGR